MSKPRLSFRMKIFIDKALPNEPFWDVCCDHGYVGIGALESRKFPYVYFVDQLPHIMKKLEIFIDKAPDTKKNPNYLLITAPGENIKIPIEGTLLIAGVGATTIINILKRAPINAKRILLSPHLEVKKLEEYIACDLCAKRSYQLTEIIQIPEGKRMRPLYILDLV